MSDNRGPHLLTGIDLKHDVHSARSGFRDVLARTGQREAEVLRTGRSQPAPPIASTCSEYANLADERAASVPSVVIAAQNRMGRRPSESVSLTSPAEAAHEAPLRAMDPELRRATGRLSELL